MINHPDRKPQTPRPTTEVRQQTGWQDGWNHSGSAIIRGDRPTYDRQCKKSAPAPMFPVMGDDTTPSA